MFLFTLYLILKNEEDRILKTLEDYCPHVDGTIVIVMDTSSTDSTEEICRKYLKSINKEFKIYHNKFENYSQQRNYALSKCLLENSYWVMYADANDRCDNFDDLIGYLNAYKKDYKITSLAVLMNISGNESYTPIITRNTNKVYYEGDVHERITQNGETQQLVESSFVRWQYKENDRTHRATDETVKKLEDKIRAKKDKKLSYTEHFNDVLQLIMEYENLNTTDAYEKIIVEISKLLKYSVKEFGASNEQFTTSFYPYLQFRLGRAKFLYKNPDWKMHIQEALKYTRHQYLEALLFYAMSEYEDGQFDIAEKLLTVLIAYNSAFFMTNIYLWGEKNNFIDKHLKYIYAQKYLDEVYNTEGGPRYVEGAEKKDINYFIEKIKNNINYIEPDNKSDDVGNEENKQLEGERV